jgi:glycylpeptide N-tetradecanoyltransferase
VKEVHTLLQNHYVEDDAAMFRFRYSESFLNWALKSPGWKKEWHVGMRVSKSRQLVATIFGVPIDLRVRDRTFRSAEINCKYNSYIKRLYTDFAK